MINPVILEMLIKTIIIIGVMGTGYIVMKNPGPDNKILRNYEPEDFDFGKYDEYE